MSYLVLDGPFSVTMDHQSVSVLRIPPASIPKIAWWLIREYCRNWKNKTYFNSLLMDDDGLTAICHPDKVSTIQLLNIDDIEVSSEKWISLIINFTGSASELPGIVHYLADALSSDGISILHISTFDSEVFLVQEHDIDRACNILKTIGNLQLYVDALNTNSSSATSLSAKSIASSGSTAPTIKEGFKLKVLPNNLLLTKLNNEVFTVNQCSDILMKLLLYDPRYSYLERVTQKQENNINRTSYNRLQQLNGVSNGDSSNSHHGSRPSSLKNIVHDEYSFVNSALDNLPDPVNMSSSPNLRASKLTKAFPNFNNTKISNNLNTSSSTTTSFLWCFCQNGDEITLLLDESDIEQFPIGALQISPQHWKVIKLSGRAIEYDETGIVSAMSQIERGIPALNISTALTNCTLVPEELLHSTLDSLSNKLNLPIEPSLHDQY